MIQGFKTFVPSRAGDRQIRLSRTVLTIGHGWANFLTAESYHLGFDGSGRFALEPARDGTGTVRIHSSAPSRRVRGFVCTQPTVVAFIRRSLKLKNNELLTMQAKEVDGVLMFGVLDSEIRDKKKEG